MTSAVLAGRNEVHHAHPAHRPYGGPCLVPRPPRPNPKRHRPPGPNPNPAPPPAGALVPYYAALPPEPAKVPRRMTIRVSEMTRLEARQAQARLTGELGRVRALLARIDAYQQDVGRRRREEAPAPAPRHAAASPMPPALRAAMLKRCGQILTRLRRQKVCHWFNYPVDVEGLKLYDYHAIIRRPMDLGTVKANLAAGRYPSHEEFAADVRLTFHNALRYNPAGHQVHMVAGNLLSNFEGLYADALAWFEQEFQRLEPPMPLALLPPSPPPPPPQPVSVPLQVVPPPPRVGAGGRRPKPKARDPHKREMDEEEKQKLREEIEKLPIEKQDGLAQIVRKRSRDPALMEEEFELDLDELDVETLWELDRYVVNWRKVSSKGRRNLAVNGESAVMNGEMVDVKVARDEVGVVQQVDVNPPMMVEIGHSEINMLKHHAEADEYADEYVDIGDEMPTVNYQSVEIEKDAQMASSSSSESGSASSSNGSDSRSSADSDSDGGDSCSPA